MCRILVVGLALGSLCLADAKPASAADERIFADLNPVVKLHALANFDSNRDGWIDAKDRVALTKPARILAAADVVMAANGNARAHYEQILSARKENRKERWKQEKERERKAREEEKKRKKKRGNGK